MIGRSWRKGLTILGVALGIWSLGLVWPEVNLVFLAWPALVTGSILGLGVLILLSNRERFVPQWAGAHGTEHYPQLPGAPKSSSRPVRLTPH